VDRFRTRNQIKSVSLTLLVLVFSVIWTQDLHLI